VTPLPFLSHLFRRAFTLVEVIVVIIVLGVLTTVAFAVFSSSINDSRVETASSSLSSLDREARALRALTPDQTGPLTEGEADRLTLDGNVTLIEDAGEVTGAEMVVSQVGDEDVCATLTFDQDVAQAGVIDVAPCAEGGGQAAPSALYTVSTHEQFQDALNDDDELVEDDGPLTILITPDATISTETDGELTYDGAADLILDGDDTVTLTGGGENRILNADSSDAATIEIAGAMTWKDGSVEGGFPEGAGGALLAGDLSSGEGVDVIISGAATFTDNTAGSGGAIRADGDVTISGAATFTTNSSTDSDGGGAILAFGDVDVSGAATFTGNTAGSGGAILSSGGGVVVSGAATFTGNTANSFGGAILAFGGDVVVSGAVTFAGENASDGTNWTDPADEGTDDVAPEPTVTTP